MGDILKGIPPFLRIDAEEVVLSLTTSLYREINRTGYTRGIIGLSGGIDSAVSLYLSVRALGPENVIAVRMPYRTSSPDSLVDAQLVVGATGVRSVTVEITPQIDAYFQNAPDASLLRRGNKMARERMSVLYDVSAEHGALVIGTSNRSEILLGYGTQHGDIACAVNPLGDLYKSHVFQLAAFLEVPSSILRKPPSADLWEGQTDEQELGFSYSDVDQLLHYMVDQRYSIEQVRALSFSQEFITCVQDRIARNEIQEKTRNNHSEVNSMAGHSKWKNIQHRKERQDALKGKLFAKFAREIYVAAYQGDKDPANNQKLRMTILKAKSHNMPNDNIERALKKAAGEIGGKVYEEVTYEGYGPGGVAIMVETLTDNRNRTAADMRYAFSKHGGNLGESGCVAWMFERKGLLFIEQGTSALSEEEVMLAALEIGAEDVEATEQGYTIVSLPENTDELRAALEMQGFIISMAEVTWVPSNKIALEEEGQEERLFQLVDVLEEYDDVQSVYTNVE